MENASSPAKPSRAELQAMLAALEDKVRRLERECDSQQTRAGREKEGLQTLREKEERLRLALESAQIGTWDYDLRTGEVVWDERSLLLFDRPAGPFSYADFLSMVDPEDRRKVDEAAQAALDPASDGAYQMEFRVTWPDGSRHWLLGKGQVIFSEEPPRRPLRFIGTNIDLTQSKQAEEALRRNEALLRQAGQMAAFGAWETDLVSLENFSVNPLRWSAQTYRIFGYEPGGVEVSNDLFFRSSHPDDRPRVMQAFLRALKSKAAYSIEHRIVRPDGTVRVVLEHADPLFDSRGRPVRMIGSVQDITERKHYEEALRESQADLHRAQSVAHVGSWRLKVKQNVLSWSEETYRIFGLPQDAPLSYTIFLAIVHPDDREYVDRNWQAALNGAPYNIEHRILVEGRVKWIRERAELEFDEKGELLGGFGTAQDITELKRIEEELMQAKEAAEVANRAKSDFLANMSHEIRTPMTVIMGALEHLALSCTPDERKRLLAMALDSAERLLALINDVLDVSRIESRRIELLPEPFDLRDCIEKAVRLFELKAAEKNLHLSCQVDPALPTHVFGDCDRIGQILVNLLGNAVKFTDSGTVAVSAVPGPGKDRIVFAVRDTGIGIPAGKQDALFESFSQVDSSRSRRYGGTGLGLAISKGLVELMGGTIGFESREGEGSTFTFILPLPAAAKEDLPAEGMLAAEPVAPAARVLLVEDDAMLRDLLSMTLGQRDWSIRTAGDGCEALTACAEERFDLVLMDLQMPHMDGLEATRRIRQGEVDTGGRIPIVGLTAHARPEDARMCFDAGMDEVLTKPVNLERLCSTIARRLGTRPPSCSPETGKTTGLLP